MHRHPLSSPRAPGRLPATAALLLLPWLFAACGGGTSGDEDRYRRLVQGVTVRGVSLFQSVEVPLWNATGEVAELNADLVDGKPGEVVVFLEPDATFAGGDVTVALGLDRGTGLEWREQLFAPTVASTLENPDTVVRFPLTASELSGALSLAVAVVDPLAAGVADGTPHAARYPADGTARALTLQSAGPPVRLVLIPIRYARDGNEYVPDTSAEQLELYRQALLATYPAVAWDLVLHEEVYWDDPPSVWGGFDFTDLNNHLMDLKSTDGDLPESHYYGLVAPAASFANYCRSACVTGQSFLVDQAEASGFRVGAGVGFTGNESAWTMVHELGHMFGRGHSGCSVPRDDRDFPYAGGLIGVWGRDPRDGRFIRPSTSDFMGYCTPQWVSDYTWNNLFTRLEDLSRLYAKRAPDRYRVLHIDLDAGTARWAGATAAGDLSRGPTFGAELTRDGRLERLDLPVVWQSDRRHGSVLVPLDRAADLHALPGLTLLPAP